MKQLGLVVASYTCFHHKHASMMKSQCSVCETLSLSWCHNVTTAVMKKKKDFTRILHVAEQKYA